MVAVVKVGVEVLNLDWDAEEWDLGVELAGDLKYHLAMSLSERASLYYSHQY